MNHDNLQKIKNILSKSNYAVFFGGAGVSTDSGIPDFRGNGGLYNSDADSNEYYLSKFCLLNEPQKFFEFFRENMLFENAKPNASHFALASLEKIGMIKSIITQNIDGLHQRAGSNRVIELHGTASSYYCTKCRKRFSQEILTMQTDVPTCDECGALVRPDVTLYGEALDGFSFADATREIKKADLLIVGGTSLVVNPTASLVDEFVGEHLIIINYSPTPYDKKAEYVVRESVSEVLTALAE